MARMSDNRRKALVLITVLWFVAILGIVVASMRKASALDRKVSVSRTDEYRCKWACRAGMETAAGILNDDGKASDGPQDLWSDNPDDFENVELEKCIFNVSVADEAGKLNINAASKKQLMALPNMTAEIADAIIDWRDKDDTPEDNGAEAGYYEGLPYRYRIQNGLFTTIRELLKVKGVTEELLFGRRVEQDDGQTRTEEALIDYLTCYSYEKNEDASDTARININKASEEELIKSLGLSKGQAKWVVDNRGSQYKTIGDLVSNSSPKEKPAGSSGEAQTAEPIDLQTFASIADKITISDDSRAVGRVNINTASIVVLTAMAEGGEKGESIAAKIIDCRLKKSGSIESIGELLGSGGIDIETFKAIANYICTRSDVYTIRSVAEAQVNGISGASMQVEAVVDRSEKPYGILYWYEGAGD